jgi:DNA-binding response OmpR family regulator
MLKKVSMILTVRTQVLEQRPVVKILLVEDDEHTCELVSATLEAHRYAVDVVTDGEAGLEMALQWPYDLMLLDVMLPRLNGIEVCRRLRSKSCQTPILILTTRGASEDVIAGLDAGADDYVVKSCEPDQLMARVRALLRRGNGDYGDKSNPDLGGAVLRSFLGSGNVSGYHRVLSS